jgi:phosphoglycolate phosphatase
MSYQLIIFDWDGTLYDSSAMIVTAVQDAARQIEVPIPDAATIKSLIGLSAERALSQGQPHLSPMQQAELVKRFRANLADSPMQPQLFPGALETLNQLKQAGYWLSIATGKSRAGLDKDLESLGLKDFFLATRCSDQSLSKPDPAMANEILDELGVEKQNAIVIGDTEYDMLMAQNAGIDAVAVSYGVHSEDRLQQSNVKALIHDIVELPKALENL